MTHQNDYTFRTMTWREKGLEAVPELMRVLINNVMQAERSKYLQAGEYERTEDRKGHANGYKPKTVRTRVGEITFAVPQVREGGFYPSALEKGLRSERALVTTLAEMYVQGVSTRKVKAITEELCGIEISAMQVSRATAQLDAVLQEWRERPLGEITYLYVDARYEKVREAGQVRDAAVLVATGITPAGERQVLGVSVSLSEHETHWKAFLQGLKDRGMHGVKLVISDDHAGLGAARQSGLGQCPLAALPVPPAAECRGLCAQTSHADGSGRRYPVHVQCPGPKDRRGIPASCHPEICCLSSTIVGLAGGEPGGRVYRVRLSAGTPAIHPHHQQPGTDQQGDPQTHPGGGCLSE